MARVWHLALNDVHGLTAVLMLLSERERRALHILSRAHAPARPNTAGPQGSRLPAFSLGKPCFVEVGDAAQTCCWFSRDNGFRQPLLRDLGQALS